MNWLLLQGELLLEHHNVYRIKIKNPHTCKIKSIKNTQLQHTLHRSEQKTQQNADTAWIVVDFLCI